MNFLKKEIFVDKQKCWVCQEPEHMEITPLTFEIFVQSTHKIHKNKLLETKYITYNEPKVIEEA